MKEINQGVTHQPQLAYDLSPRGSITYTSRGGIVETTPIIPEISNSGQENTEPLLYRAQFVDIVDGHVTQRRTVEVHGTGVFDFIDLFNDNIENPDSINIFIDPETGGYSGRTLSSITFGDGCTGVEHFFEPFSEGSLAMINFTLNGFFFKELIISDSVAFITGYLFDDISCVNITCLATTPPTIELDGEGGFYECTLYVPEGATGYDAWLEQLGSGWDIVYIQDGWDPYAGDDFFVRLVVSDDIITDDIDSVGVLKGVELQGSGTFTGDMLHGHIAYYIDSETGDDQFQAVIQIITGNKCDSLGDLYYPHSIEDENPFVKTSFFLKKVVLSETVLTIDDNAFNMYCFNGQNLDQQSKDAVIAINPNITFEDLTQQEI